MPLTDDEVEGTVPDVEGAETQKTPTVHNSVQRPLCSQCAQKQMYFDLKCSGCRAILYQDTTTIAQVFAILRQWNPETQQNIEFYIREILKRGAHADDRDASTGMTLLHFAVKAGADGICDPRPASRAIKLLLSKGACINARCKSTDMTPIHYAAFFNSPTLIDLLMSYNIELDMQDTSTIMEGASPLHMAATTMAYDAAFCLLKYGADPRQKDAKGRLPVQCIPTVDSANADAVAVREKLRQMLSCETDTLAESIPIDSQPPAPLKTVEKKVGVNVGDDVIVGGIKRGWLRFVGAAQFAPGIWAGVELVDAIGKNNGTLNGVRYFTCKPNHGIFAPLSKVTKFRNRKSRRTLTKSASSSTIHLGKVDVSGVGSKIETGRTDASTTDNLYTLGDHVEIAGRRRGIIRYIGETHFANGIWYGIELTNAVGKNNGTINDVQYFQCRPDRGIFAPPSRVRKLRTSLTPHISTDGPQISGSKKRHRFTRSETAFLASRNAHSSTSRAMKAGKSMADVSKSENLSQRYRAKSAVNLYVRKSLSLTQSNSATGDLKLEEGVSVYCSNDLGVIRFMGPVHFANGIWLGVEFKTANGKNDGTVDGRRYFTCPPNHGRMVRPNRVSIRGINGAKLLDYIGEETAV